MENIVSIKQLLEVGVHFGHQTKRWNPKMKKYIYAEKNGIYIIDLQQTLQLLTEAYQHVKIVAANSGIILFVGTKKQIQDVIENYAKECEMPYVRNRWLGGTLTNFKTISQRIKRIDEIEEMEKAKLFEKLPKTEVLQIKKEYEKLLYNIGGIRQLKRLPDLLYVIDPHKESIAVEEARKLNIPIVGLVDTNCDPDKVDYVIPGNDDAIRSCSLITSIICNAVKEGRSSLQNPDEEAVDKTLEEETYNKAVSYEGDLIKNQEPVITNEVEIEEIEDYEFDDD